MDGKLDAAYLAARLAEKFQKKSNETITLSRVAQEIENIYRAARIRFPPANLDRLGHYLRIGEVRESPLAIRGRLLAEQGRIVIEVNIELPKFEKRQVIAHELAHIIFDQERLRSGFYNSGKRGDETRSEYEDIEKLCDIAADEILLPEKWLVSQVARQPSLLIVEKISRETDCSLEFVSERILMAGLWKGCHFIWWTRMDDKMVVSRTLPKESAVGLSFYEELSAIASLPGRALSESGLIRGKIRINNGITNNDYPAECMQISETEVLALVK
jgi:hypothetical protein